MATDTLEIFGTEYSGVTGVKATDSNNQTKTYIRPQGTVTISALGNTDVTAYETATVADANCIATNIKKDVSIMGVTGSYEGSGTSKNVQVVQGTTRTNSSTLTAVGAELTVSKTGTYDVYWSGMRSNTSSSYTWGTQLYVGGSAYGSENTTWSNNVQNNHLTNVSLTANQKIRVYGRNTRGTSYYIYAPMLVIVEA